MNEWKTERMYGRMNKQQNSMDEYINEQIAFFLTIFGTIEHKLNV